MKVMIAVFRIHLSEVNYSGITWNQVYINAKHEALMSVAAVCRYWKRLVTSSNSNSTCQHFKILLITINLKCDTKIHTQNQTANWQIFQRKFAFATFHAVFRPHVVGGQLSHNTAHRIRQLAAPCTAEKADLRRHICSQ